MTNVASFVTFLDASVIVLLPAVIDAISDPRCRRRHIILPNEINMTPKLILSTATNIDLKAFSDMKLVKTQLYLKLVLLSLAGEKKIMNEIEYGNSQQTTQAMSILFLVISNPCLERNIQLEHVEILLRAIIFNRRRSICLGGGAEFLWVG